MNTCLRIQPSEKVTLITDNACREIAASIAQELIKVGCAFKAFVLEDLAPRPLAGLPHEIAEDMETSDVSIFAVRVQTNELKSRMEMTAIVNRRRMRHAHMVNINRQIMLEGMRADFNRVDALSSKVMEIVSNAKEIHRQNRRRLRLHRHAQPRTIAGSRPAASSAATNGAICPAAKSLPRRAK